MPENDQELKDYSRFFEKKENFSKKEPKEKVSGFKKFSLLWKNSNPRTKIEILVIVGALIVAVVFVVYYLSKHSQKSSEELYAPPAEENFEK